jgi:hypothetical protein
MTSPPDGADAVAHDLHRQPTRTPFGHTLMPTALHWDDVAIRLALTLLGAGVIGLDRSEHGSGFCFFPC